VTEHVRTNLDVIGRFGGDVCLDRGNDGGLALAASVLPAVR
jgi:hypothetical protein